MRKPGKEYIAKSNKLKVEIFGRKQGKKLKIES